MPWVPWIPLRLRRSDKRATEACASRSGNTPRSEFALELAVGNLEADKSDAPPHLDDFLSVIDHGCNRVAVLNLLPKELGLLHDQVTVSVTRPDWPVWS